MQNKHLLAAFGLLVGCAIPYFRILQNGFIYTWDDDVYVLDNPFLRSLSWEHLKVIFTTELGANYHPITHLSLALEYQLFDGAAWGFHLVSLLLHLANVALVAYLTYLLFNKKIEIALVAGFVFGLHPMHVESVAWVSERKDVLFLFFLLASLIFYHFYIHKKNTIYFVSACLLATLSMLSKPAAVVLPALLLLMDWWYRRRLNVGLILEKTPFALLSLGLVVLTLYFQSQYEALNKIHVYTLSERLVFACYAWLMYLGKFFVPVSLSGFYHYPPLGAPLPLAISAAPLILFSLLFFLIWKGRKSRLLVFSIVFFTLSLLPVLQIIPVGSSVISERYTYLPYVGLGFGIAGFVLFLMEKHPRQLAIQTAVMAALCTLLALGTWERCGVWKNDFTFWSDVIKKQPLAVNGHTHLGTYFRENNESVKSLEYYNRALDIHPEFGEALAGKALVLYDLDDFEYAEAYFTKAIRQMPEVSVLYLFRAKNRVRREKYKLALEDFDTCLKMGIHTAELFNHRAFVYAMQNDYDAAYKDWKTAVELGSQDATVFFNLGKHYQEEGNYQKSLEYLKKAVSLDPESEQFKLTLDSLEQVLKL